MRSMGIDIGTTTISLVMLDADTGTLADKRTVPSNSFLPGTRPSSREQDPEKIWAVTLREMQSMIEANGKPDCIGMTGQMHGMLYIDREGRHISPLYTWQDGSGNEPIPTASGKCSAHLLKENSLPAASGYGLTTYYYHVLTNQVPAQAAGMATISDYIAMRLTGRKDAVIANDMAASWGCFDLRTNTFCEEKMQALGMNLSLLPTVVKGHEMVGRISKEFAWAEGVPVMTSLGDNQASFLGAVQAAKNPLASQAPQAAQNSQGARASQVATAPQDIRSTVLINIGTGSQVSYTTDEYREITGSVELRPCSGAPFLMVGASLCGGRAYAMLENFYKKLIADALGEEAAETVDYYKMMEHQARDFRDRHPSEKPAEGKPAEGKPAEGKPVEGKPTEAKPWRVTPTFAGTRDNPEEKGSIEGIDVGNFEPGAFTLGVINGIITELHDMYLEMCKATGTKATRLVGSGNALRRNALMRECAEEIFGMKMTVPQHEEEAAYGAAQTAILPIQSPQDCLK